VAALGLIAIAALIAILGFNVVAAAVGWPGLIIVNAVCAQFGIYLHEFPTWTWLVPGLLVDLVLYTLVFFACAKLWSTLVRTRAKLPPTIKDRRPTAPL